MGCTSSSAAQIASGTECQPNKLTSPASNMQLNHSRSLTNSADCAEDADSMNAQRPSMAQNDDLSSESPSITSRSLGGSVELNDEGFDPSRRASNLPISSEMRAPSAIAAFARSRFESERTLLATRDTRRADAYDDALIDKEWHSLQEQLHHPIKKGAPKIQSNALLKKAHALRQVQTLHAQASRKSSSSSEGSKTHSPHRSQSAWSEITFLASGAIGLQDFYNSFNAGVVRPFLKEQDYMLIVDTRPAALYKQDHIITAINSTSCEDLLAKYELSDFNFVILYDDGSREGSADSMCAQLRLDSFEHIGVLKGGLPRLRSRYSCLITKDPVSYAFRPELREQLPTFPSEVWPSFIYLGNRIHAADRAVVKGLGLTHIVNCSIEHPNTFEAEQVSYFNVRLQDEKGSNIKQYFAQLCKFLGTAQHLFAREVHRFPDLKHLNCDDVQCVGAQLCDALLRRSRWQSRPLLGTLYNGRVQVVYLRHCLLDVSLGVDPVSGC
eukprot:TRINITY_DN10012_c0_g1_i4.p1 TRINITY_DN10012_c0_g1~~TRINITY_DN10012_c0_g1_i4.p1  ORF type:complete len:497 (+),score=36.04 TRINITY_DN10012_c0_g1_i4:133-1623(+)